MGIGSGMAQGMLPLPPPALDRGGCPGVGAAAEQGGGDGADGQGGHDQHGVPGDRVVEADLGLAEAEASLPGLEIFFSRPAAADCADQPGQ